MDAVANGAGEADVARSAGDAERPISDVPVPTEAVSAVAAVDDSTISPARALADAGGADSAEDEGESSAGRFTVVFARCFRLRSGVWLVALLAVVARGPWRGEILLLSAAFALMVGFGRNLSGRARLISRPESPSSDGRFAAPDILCADFAEALDPTALRLEEIDEEKDGVGEARPWRILNDSLALAGDACAVGCSESSAAMGGSDGAGEDPTPDALISEDVA